MDFCKSNFLLYYTHSRFFLVFLFSSNNSFSNAIAQSGVMILPPVSFPFGGQITRINANEFERALRERSRSSKHRTLTQHSISNKTNNVTYEQIQRIKLKS